VSNSYRLAIIGGGINGLCAAFSAAARGTDRVVLIDQFSPGHNRGSSHGHSRITRSAYISEDYVSLMQVAHEQAWPEIESVIGDQLIYPSEGCFFGPVDSKYASYAKAVTNVGVDCVEIDVEDARKRYPQFKFAETPGVILDRTAGLVAASKAIGGLYSYAGQRMDVLENMAVLDVDLSSSPVRIRTATDTLTTEAVIITAGPWVRNLVPTLNGQVSVARQTVSYVRLKTDQDAHQLGNFPVWGNLGRRNSIGYYGLPEFGQPGIKVAKHIIRGRDDDPDQPRKPTDEDVEDLRAFIRDCFVPEFDKFEGIETCHYTNTSNEDYIIDHHPDNPACVIGAGFSGHGFKLGPVTGRALADLALDGAPSCDTFARVRNRFKLKG